MKLISNLINTTKPITKASINARIAVLGFNLGIIGSKIYYASIMTKWYWIWKEKVYIKELQYLRSKINELK